MWTKGRSCMSTNPLPLTQSTPAKPSLKAPLILLALMFIAASVGIRWVRSLSQAASPIFHQTKTGWQQLPSPTGFPEKLRVSSSGTVWVLTWGRTALSRWDGSGGDITGLPTAEPRPAIVTARSLWMASRSGPRANKAFCTGMASAGNPTVK